MIDLDFSIRNNDCGLVSDDENMSGACIRRLAPVVDSTLDEEYGSNLRGLLGLKKSEVNLDFLGQTINNCLKQDARITETSVTCKYSDDGILADITIVYEDNELSFTYENTEELSDG